MIALDELNRLPPAEFRAAIRPLFEAADPLAERLAAARPFTSYSELIERAEYVALTDLSRAEQIAVVNAHPRIGAEPNTVSAESYREQGYAAEAAHDGRELERVYAELATLNEEYERRFGFRFVVFVDGRSKAEILDVLRARSRGDPDSELRTALEAMMLIARDRLRGVS